MRPSILCSLLLVLGTTVVTAQMAPIWTFDLPAESKSLLLLPQAKLAYYATPDDELICFDYVDRAIRWRRTIPGLHRSGKLSALSYPMVAISKLPFVESRLSGDRYMIVHAESSDVLFDTETVDMDNIKWMRFVSPDKLGIIVKGKKDKERVYGYAALGEPGPRWVRPLPVELKAISGGIIGH